MTSTRRAIQVGAALLAVLLLVPAARAQEVLRVPPRLTLALVPLDDEPASRGDCALLARLATGRLGVPAEKAVVVERPDGPDELLALFAPDGPLSARLAHRELLLVALCGGHGAGPRHLSLARGRVPVADVVRAANRLVFPATTDEDAYFRGGLAILFDATPDLSSAGVPAKLLRNTVLLGWPAGAGSEVDAAAVEAAAGRSPAIRGAGIDALLAPDERYRPGLLSFALAAAAAARDRATRSADLPALAARADRLLGELGGAGRIDRHRLRVGAGFAPAAFPLILGDVRVFIEYRAAATISDPAAGAASLLETYLGLEGASLLNGPGVYLVDETGYEDADVSCVLLTFEGRINVMCAETDGVTLVETSFDPKEFEANLPDLAVQILNRYMVRPSEAARLVLEGRPRHVVLLIDRSWSTAFTDPTAPLFPIVGRRDGIRKMAFLRVANELFHPSRAGWDRNRLTAVFFAREATVLSFTGADLALYPSWLAAAGGLAEAFDRDAAPQPGTDIARALDRAVEILTPDLGAFECHVLLFTDGVDRGPAAEHLRERLRAVQAKRGGVHVVGLVPPPPLLTEFKRAIGERPEVLAAYVRAILPAADAARELADEDRRRWHVEGVRRYAYVDLDWAEETVAETAGTAHAGVFTRTTSPRDLTLGLERIFALFHERRVLTSVVSDSRVAGQDTFTFAIEDEGEYELVLSNQRQLAGVGFTATRDGAEATARLDVDTSNPTQTVIRIRGDARGEWTLTRTGGGS